MDTSLPFDFEPAVDTRGRIRRGALLAALARRPHRIPALLALARDCRHAAAHLAGFLDQYVGLVQSRFDLLPSPVATAI
jgi:hypothetical protein